MPEIPDLEAYLAALRPRVVGAGLERVRLANPFLLRTVEPPLGAVEGGRVSGVERLGKRIVLAVEPARPVGPPAASARRAAGPDLDSGLEPEPPLFLVLHLMVAGRLHWKPVGEPIPKGRGLAAFDFDTGSLLLTEAGKKRRASLHLVRGRDALRALDPGGLETTEASFEEFRAALSRENHTLKRALTDPHILSGIGNAYSDEILHRARLSPFKQTDSLEPDEWARLHRATVEVLDEWTGRLVAETGEGFPEKVTAFREEMAVHGRYGRPCPVCGTEVQRIRYADNECNYCPRCQTDGRVLADRALSRLLKDSWPKTIEELEGKGRR